MVLATTLLLGCDPPGNIGVTPLTPVETLYTDTLTVRTSTVLADSVRTGNPDVFLAGRYVDPLFGTVTASSFIRMSLATQLSLDATAVYDSLTLNMVYGYTYGDTLPAQTLSVHRLREVIDPTVNYYNNSRVAYDPTPLAKKTFLARPGTDGSLRFRMPDALGRELIALSGQPAGETNAEFAKVLAGLALIPDSTNTAVVGFQATGGALRLNLWYHTTADTARKVYTLPAVAVTPQGAPIFRGGFNRVTANRSGTPLAGLKPLVPVPAGDGPTYVQDALGIRTKIEIPYLKSLASRGPIAVNRAELQIKPDLTVAGPGLGISPYLVLLETDATNRVLYNQQGYTSLVYLDQSAYTNATDPRLVQIATYDSRFRRYTWGLTTHLNAILTGYKKTDSFLVTPVYTTELGQGGSRFESQMNNRVTRMALSSKPGDTKLILFYTEAKE